MANVWERPLSVHERRWQCSRERAAEICSVLSLHLSTMETSFNAKPPKPLWFRKPEFGYHTQGLFQAPHTLWVTSE